MEEIVKDKERDSEEMHRMLKNAIKMSCDN